MSGWQGDPASCFYIAHTDLSEAMCWLQTGDVCFLEVFCSCLCGPSLSGREGVRYFLWKAGITRSFSAGQDARTLSLLIGVQLPESAFWFKPQSPVRPVPGEKMGNPTWDGPPQIVFFTHWQGETFLPRPLCSQNSPEGPMSGFQDSSLHREVVKRPLNPRRDPECSYVNRVC